MAVKLKDVNDLDVEALDAVEYSTEEYTTYTGEVPPVGIELTGYVKRIWWTRTAPKQGGGGDDPMLKVLWVAADNEGEYEEYNECPFWLNAPLVAGAKFRWAPFLDVYGLTLRQVKSNTFISPKEDQNGAPIERIGQWKPGEDSDAAWCRIITGEEPYNGVMQARVKEWLMWDEEASTEPDGEAAEPEDGEGSEDEEGVELFEDADGNLVDAEGNFYDEDGVLIEEEAVADPEPPARARRAAKAPAAAKPARTASPAPATRPRATASAKAAKPAPATTRPRAAAPARAAKATAKPAARAGRGRAAAAQNEPPF